MSKTTMILGIVALLIGGGLYLLGMDQFHDVLGGVNVNIYATWFFVLLGGLLIVWSFVSRRPAS